MQGKVGTHRGVGLRPGKLTFWGSSMGSEWQLSPGPAWHTPAGDSVPAGLPAAIPSPCFLAHPCLPGGN